MSLNLFLICLAIAAVIVIYLIWPRRIFITRVVDGDSLEAVYKGRSVRIRIIGCDAPEYSQPWGKESRSTLNRLVDNYTFRLSPPKVDKYGRLIGMCYAGLLPVSWRLIWAGAAWPDTRFGFFISAFPRVIGAGLWGESRPVHPARWRSR